MTANLLKLVTTRIVRTITIPENVMGTSLFCLFVQANGADAFKLALIHISEKLNRLDAQIVHTQHDDIIVEAREEIADQVRATVKGAMEEALRKIIPRVTFTVEPKIAASWKSYNLKQDSD